jgi:hypothetical protein
MFRYGFFPRTQKMESRPWDFFEHFGFKEQIGYVFHVNSLPRGFWSINGQ